MKRINEGLSRQNNELAAKVHEISKINYQRTEDYENDLYQAIAELKDQIHPMKNYTQQIKEQNED